MVCHEDLSHAQHLHHYGVVLEEDHHDVPTPSASREVRADLGTFLRNIASHDQPAILLVLWGLVQVVSVLLGLVI